MSRCELRFASTVDFTSHGTPVALSQEIYGLYWQCKLANLTNHKFPAMGQRAFKVKIHFAFAFPCSYSPKCDY